MKRTHLPHVHDTSGKKARTGGHVLARATPWASFQQVSRQLDQSREKIAELPNGHAQLPALQERQKALERDVKIAYEKLQFPDKIQARLPLEIRKMIYSHLYDTTKPIILPRVGQRPPNYPEASPFSEDSDDVAEQEELATNVDPFRNNAVFDPLCVGPRMYREMREDYLENTPLYIRDDEFTQKALSMPLPSGKLVKEVIQHLRVYIRIEDFVPEVVGWQEFWNYDYYAVGENQYEGWGQMEREWCENKCAGLARVLNDVPWKKGSTLELDMVHNFDHQPHRFDQRRLFLNWTEMLKPTYFHAKREGANVSARIEVSDGYRSDDVTWKLDLDEEGWAQRQRQTYIGPGEEKPSHRVEWEERIEAQRDLHRPHGRAWMREIIFPGEFTKNRFSKPEQ